MTHRWESKFSITKIRSTRPCSKFQQNFGILSFSFSQFKLCLGFRGCPKIFSEVKLYIVIHIIYLCGKPDSVDFPRKNPQFFDTKTYFKSQISAYFRSFFFLQEDGFLCNGSSIPSYFHTYNCNFARIF